MPILLTVSCPADADSYDHIRAKTFTGLLTPEVNMPGLWAFYGGRPIQLVRNTIEVNGEESSCQLNLPFASYQDAVIIYFKKFDRTVRVILACWQQVLLDFSCRNSADLIRSGLWEARDRPARSVTRRVDDMVSPTDHNLIDLAHRLVWATEIPASLQQAYRDRMGLDPGVGSNAGCLPPLPPAVDPREVLEAARQQAQIENEREKPRRPRRPRRRLFLGVVESQEVVDKPNPLRDVLSQNTVLELNEMVFGLSDEHRKLLRQVANKRIS